MPRYSIDWQCKACRFEQALVVRVASAGEADDEPGPLSRENAQFFLQSIERNSVHMKLARRPCPKCGAIDRQKLALGATRSFLVATLLAASTGLVELLTGELAVPLAWIFCAAPVVGLGWTAYQLQVRWRLARLDVAVEA